MSCLSTILPHESSGKGESIHDSVPMKKGSTKQSFGIEQLFGSKTRSRLLQLFLKSPESHYFVRELTRKIDAQLNSVRREIAHLVQLGLLEEVSGDDIGEKKGDRKKYYRVNKGFALFEELQSLFTKASVLIQQDLAKTLLEDQPIQVLILTGVFVGKGEGETDMLIVGNPDEKMLQEKVSEFEMALGRELNYTVMPTEEYLYRRDISDRFLVSILDGQNVILQDRL